MLEQLSEAVRLINTKTDLFPEIGIILGTGLGSLAGDIKNAVIIPYSDIPGFPESTVEGHKGRLIIGSLEGKQVVVMQGRFHYYEGYNMKELTFPVRLMKFLGIKYLFVSNASGGLNRSFDIGDLMIIKDHINLFPENPLRGKNNDELGPRFPDMSESYSAKLIDLALISARSLKIKLFTGVYAGLPGPSLETPAEYKMLINIGADAVGMSTVPEIIVARHMGIECFAISVISNLGIPGKIVKVSIEDVIKEAGKAEQKLGRIIRAMIDRI